MSIEGKAKKKDVTDATRCLKSRSRRKWKKKKKMIFKLEPPTSLSRVLIEKVWFTRVNGTFIPFQIRRRSIEFYWRVEVSLAGVESGRQSIINWFIKWQIGLFTQKTKGKEPSCGSNILNAGFWPEWGWKDQSRPASIVAFAPSGCS